MIKGGREKLSLPPFFLVTVMSTAVIAAGVTFAVMVVVVALYVGIKSKCTVK